METPVTSSGSFSSLKDAASAVEAPSGDEDSLQQQLGELTGSVQTLKDQVFNHHKN